MISQRCPRCNSDRIRRGYRHTPWLSRLVCRYYLLCDNCNWEFTGFAVPGTTSSKPTRRPKRRSGSSDGDSGSASPDNESVSEANTREHTEIKEETTSSERRGRQRAVAALLF